MIPASEPCEHMCISHIGPCTQYLAYCTESDNTTNLTPSTCPVFNTVILLVPYPIETNLTLHLQVINP